jgi:hypothetical protein
MGLIMSKRSGPYPHQYTIVKVDHYDGRVTYELRFNNEVVREYPETALQHAIDGLTKIEEYQGLKRESELFKLDLKTVLADIKESEAS